MQITVTTEDGGVFPLEVSLELVLEDLKAILEIEVERKAEEMVLLHSMEPMQEGRRTLGEYNVEDGDVIMLTYPYIPPAMEPLQSAPAAAVAPQATLPDIDWGAISVPSPQQRGNPPPRSDPDDPEQVRLHFLSHPSELAMLRQQNPPLAAALESGNAETFRSMLQSHTRAVREIERQRIRMLNADPMDPETQQRIAQDIQQKNIEENMQAAMEYTPESFSNVVMLYVLIKVNGVPVKAMVDSGAAGTIMSNGCAERCNIMRLVDKRFSGMAVGVGTQRIIGKVHLGTIQIGEDFLTSSFKVLEEQTEDMLLGLDMLRRHQCCIDLGKNVLRIGTTGNEAPFLSEADLKDKEEIRRKQAMQILEGEDADMARAIARSEKQNAQSQVHQQPGGPSQQPGPSHQPAPVSEAAIQQVVEAGFAREEAITELRKSNGNVQFAITALLAKSISLG